MRHESKYVVATASGRVDLEFPNGILTQHIAAGHRYLAREAVVQRHPELFRPWEKGDRIPGTDPAPTQQAA